MIKVKVGLTRRGMEWQLFSCNLCGDTVGRFFRDRTCGKDIVWFRMFDTSGIECSPTAGDVFEENKIWLKEIDWCKFRVMHAGRLDEWQLTLHDKKGSFFGYYFKAGDTPRKCRHLRFELLK